MKNLVRSIQDDLEQQFNNREAFIRLHFASVRCMILSLSDSVALFISCQFALESNFGNSNLALEQHNLCGMKKPLVRPSTCLSVATSNGYAYYLSDYHCLIDYFLCISYHRPMSVDLENVDKYARFIKKFYCPERDYIEKIMSIFDKYSYLLTQNSQKNEE